jgi:hypothetical protein
MADPLPAGRYRRRTVLMWVMQIIGPVGFYGFASIAPIVLLAKGFDLSHSLMYWALTALGYPLGSLVSVYLIERIERRTLLIVSTLAVAVFGVAFGLATNITSVIAAGVATTISTVVSPTSPKPTSGVVVHRPPWHRHRLAVCSLPPGRRRVAVGRPDPARGHRGRRPLHLLRVAAGRHGPHHPAPRTAHQQPTARHNLKRDQCRWA